MCSVCSRCFCLDFGMSVFYAQDALIFVSVSMRLVLALHATEPVPRIARKVFYEPVRPTPGLLRNLI
ncbi:hypothetical protein Plhal703r1_c02g0012851 [Plasmopara halstedii]